MTSENTGPYRPGGHHGVTIIRRGRQHPDAEGRRPDDRLVAVVTDGDKALVRTICELLNTAYGDTSGTTPVYSPEACSACGVAVKRFPNGMPFHMTRAGGVDVAMDGDHAPTPVARKDLDLAPDTCSQDCDHPNHQPTGLLPAYRPAPPHGALTDPGAPDVDPLYRALQAALTSALSYEDYAMAGKVCELLATVTAKINREHRRTMRQK